VVEVHEFTNVKADKFVVISTDMGNESVPKSPILTNLVFAYQLSQ